MLLVEWGITKKACPTSAGKIMTPLMPTLHHHGMDCRVELSMGRLVTHSSEGGWQGCFFLPGTTKKAALHQLAES